MPLIGINAVNEAPRKLSIMEQIQMGADAANKVLGGINSGFEAYSKNFGAQKDLVNAQTQNQKSEAAKNMFALGYMPFSGAESPKAQIQADALNTQDQAKNNLIQNGFLPADTDKLHIHANDPQIVKLGDQHFIKAFDPEFPMGEKDKLYIEHLKDQNLMLTSKNDPEATASMPLPGSGQLIAVKPTKLDKKESIVLEREGDKQFKEDETNKQNAEVHLAYLAGLSAIENPSPEKDLNLVQARIRSINPGSNVRFTADGVIGLPDKLDSITSNLMKKWQEIKSGGTKKVFLTDSERLDMVGAIKAQYDSIRPIYESNYKNLVNNNKINGLRTTTNYLSPIPPPKALSRPSNSGATNTNMMQNYAKKHGLQ